jgi:integrase
MSTHHEKPVPKYRKHKQSGQAIVTLTDGYGGRRDVLLGNYGTAASRAEYMRVLAEWEAAGRRLSKPLAADLTVNELMATFWPYAEQHYRRPDGTTTNELEDYRLTLRPLKRLYGHTPAKDFGPLALKAVRQAMLSGSWLKPEEREAYLRAGKPVGLCRGVANQRIGRIRRMFKWAVENELVPPMVYHGLQAVRGLQRGRSQARETEPVRPVPMDRVEAILPFLRPTVADMVRLQLVTGMRPGELTIMRAIDIDMSGAVWLYRPESHKTAHRGHHRIIAIGPKGQEIVRKYLKPQVEAYLFSPRDVVGAQQVEKRLKRKTKVQPSQQCRKKRHPRRVPGERYDARAYYIAIARACDQTWPLPEDLAPRVKADGKKESDLEWRSRLTPEEREQVRLWRREHRWHPHQLRHTRATDLRRQFGLDAARAILGHRSPAVTEVYAELDVGQAVEIMAKLG